MSNKHHDLLGVQKHANQHRLSRLTMEVHTDELRIMASAVESYTDELIAALEAAEKRIAQLEAIAKSVKFDPIPMEDLGNKSDGKKHPYMFGAGYNSAVVHCESVLLQAFAAAAGKGE